MNRPPSGLALRLPRYLSTEAVENLAKAAGTGDAGDLRKAVDDTPIELELYALERTLAGSEARLLGLVGALRRRRGFPSLTLRIHTGDSSVGLRPDNRHWYTLTETLLGIILLTHATAVRTQNGDPVRDGLVRQLRGVLQTHNGMLTSAAGLTSSGGRFSALAFDGPNGTSIPELFNYLDPEAGISFRRKLGELISSNCHVPALADIIIPIGDFVRETLENAQQHGTTSFSTIPRDTLRYLYVRNFPLDARGAELINASTGAPIEQFLHRFTQEYGKETPLVEISVVDDGLGIAAQMLAGDTAVYSGPVEREAEIIRHALTRDGTSKSDPDAGAGLDTALQACQQLRGLFTLRTGRCHFARDFLDDLTSPAALVTQRSDRSLALLGGTSISMLIPWLEPRLF